MGMEPASWAAIIGAVTTAASAAATYAATPSSVTDVTNYELLTATQAANDAESAAAKARIEEARKQEELRQQQLYASDILTSETGADDTSLSVRNQVLGGTSAKVEED